MTKTEFTSSAFRRSHGSDPRGRGMWAFQATSTHAAFDADLEGDVFFAPAGTLTEAKAAAADHFGPVLVAVLP